LNLCTPEGPAFPISHGLQRKNKNILDKLNIDSEIMINHKH